MKLQLEYRDIGWWYWVVSWGLIVAGLAGWGEGFYAVAGLSGVQVVHFAIAERELNLPVQVRIGFLLIMLAGLWGPLGWIYWLPAFGLAARVTVSYCLLARVISLMPWNRPWPLGADLVLRTLFSPPVDGSILEQQ